MDPPPLSLGPSAFMAGRTLLRAKDILPGRPPGLPRPALRKSTTPLEHKDARQVHPS